MNNKRSAHLERGQGIVEYALIIALVGIATILSLFVFGVSLRSVYCAAVGGLTGREDVCEPIQELLLTESFDSLDGWSFNSSGTGWVIEEGQLRATRDGEHRAFVGDSSWEDYTVTVDYADLEQGNGYGVYFRAEGEPDSINGYIFQYDPGYDPGRGGSFIIRKLDNGRESPPIAKALAPEGFDWTDATRQVSVDVRGDTYTVQLDGEEVLSVQDDTYSNGRVGLRTWDGTRATFDDLTVTR
jgi:Flp pilus assembly pilin Flp